MTRRASDTPAAARSPRLALDAWGVVFCGGASLRMGRDKARLELAGRSLLERSIEVLAGIAPRVLLASGDRARYPELGLECVLDREPGCGPLAGLAAALERAESSRVPWILALACDMPYALPEVFGTLLARARAEELDALLLATPAGKEPLYAVYHVRALPAVLAALARGERRMDAFHAEARVGTLSVGELGGDPALAGCARNLNTPQEFAAHGGALAGRGGDA